MTEQQKAFSEEIAKTIKEWSDRSETLNLKYVGSISLEDPEGDQEGINFQQCVNGSYSTIIQSVLASIEQLPTAIKIKYKAALNEAILTWDEEVEQRFFNNQN